MNQGWVKATIDEACFVEYGTRVVRKKDGGSIYPVYGGGGATFFLDTFNREDRVIIARFGMSEECTRFVGGRFYLNDSGLTLSPRNPAALDRTYLDRFTSSINDEIFMLGKGTAQKNLDIPAFRSLAIAYPASLAAQRFIVAILDEAFKGIDTAVAKTKKNLANARELFDSYLSSVFACEGKGWIEKELGDICSNITDGKHGDCQNEEGSGFYFLSAKDIKNDTLNYADAREITESDFNETHRRTNLQPGDILVTNAGTIGRTAIAPWDPKTSKTTFQKSVAILKPMQEVVDGTFCLYGLKANIIDLIKLSAGTAQKNLLLRDTRSFKIFMPQEVSQQKEIASQISRTHRESQRLADIFQRKLHSLEALKQAILHKAFSGELTAHPKKNLQQAAE
jgi:type I restriction enzyme S subunit